MVQKREQGCSPVVVVTLLGILLRTKRTMLLLLLGVEVLIRYHKGTLRKVEFQTTSPRRFCSEKRFYGEEGWGEEKTGKEPQMAHMRTLPRV